MVAPNLRVGRGLMDCCSKHCGLLFCGGAIRGEFVARSHKTGPAISGIPPYLNHPRLGENRQFSTPRPGRIRWNPDRATRQCLLYRCCMPLDEDKLALGSTLGATIFAAHLSSWYAEAMQYALFGPFVPTCRDCLADGDRRSPGWLPPTCRDCLADGDRRSPGWLPPTCRDCLADGDRRSPGWLPFPRRPGKSGNFPPQVPDFQCVILRGGRGCGCLQPQAV